MTVSNASDGMDEMMRLAVLLFLQKVRSAAFEGNARRECNDDAQDIEDDELMTDLAFRLIVTVLRLCDSVAHSDDPFGTLDRSPLMDIRLSHASRLEDETVWQIQNGVRDSFVDYVQSLHTNPKLRSSAAHHLEMYYGAVRQFEHDLERFVPILTPHMDPHCSVSSRIFLSFQSALLHIVDDQPELMRNAGMLECYQPEITIFALLGLQCIRQARVLMLEARRDPTFMFLYLFCNEDLSSVLTRRVIRYMAPLFDRYLPTIRYTRNRNRTIVIE